jgi:NhaB family Na+:H+ antiporter
MGHSPVWYKQAVIAALIINPIVYLTFGPFAAGWLILAEFIATLTLAIKCFPLLPGGIIAFQAIVLLQMATPEAVTKEIEHNMPIILLVLFLVTAVTLMKELLIFSFTKLILGIKNKTMVALLFSVLGAAMSAMLDALTVISVVVVVLTGLHMTYQN